MMSPTVAMRVSGLDGPTARAGVAIVSGGTTGGISYFGASVDPQSRDRPYRITSFTLAASCFSEKGLGRKCTSPAAPMRLDSVSSA